MQNRTLEDTVYFWIGANDTSGSGNDGASAVYDVRLAGAAADAIPTLSGSATLLSHANYPAGAYEIAVAATNANGFAADGIYSVFCTLAVDSQNPTGFVGSFELAPVKSDLLQIGGVAQSATDLKDFADSGYNPATHKVAGVLLVDKTTENSDMVAEAPAMVGTANAALASVCTVGRLAELDAANIPSDINGIKIVTDNLPDAGALTDISTYVAKLTDARMQVLTDWIIDGRLDVILDSVKSDLDLTTGSNGVILNTTQVNYAPNIVVPDAAEVAPTAAEIVAAIIDETLAELTRIPDATPKLGQALMLRYMAIRNEQIMNESSGVQSIANAAGTPIGSASLTDSGGVTTKGQYS